MRELADLYAAAHNTAPQAGVLTWLRADNKPLQRLHFDLKPNE
jgi:hypothetical protein